MRPRHAILPLALAAISLLMAGCGLLAPRQEARPDVTFPDLLEELTDLETLARTPDPWYKGVQFSSYDRASTSPLVATDKGWFANVDIGHYIRQETNAAGEVEYVALDAQGPGALVRFWSANAGGTLRIYLDDATTPTLELPMQDFMRGDTAPYLAPIAGVHGLGWNNFYPIPFAEHCKVTFTQQSTYYHINARLYEEGTRVESYHPDMAQAYADHLEILRERLEAPETQPAFSENENIENRVTLAPGQSWQQTLDGPAALRRLSCRAEADDLETALRKTLLTIHFDGIEPPSVSAPLSDFFGSGLGLNPFQSLPVGVLEDGRMYCHYVMPFRRQARLAITNHGDQPLTLDLQALTGPWRFAKDSLYFNAKWHAVNDIATRPWSDVNVVSAQGSGHYVGTVYHVANPIVNWWGEGDEKIYIDGEEFPSTFGTGTEDYFGYAWCWFETFNHALHNQVRRDGPGNFGHTVDSRYHMLDALPFRDSLRFDIEAWHHIETEMDLGLTPIWYASADTIDNVNTPAPEDLIVPEIPEPRRVPGVIEGEDMTILAKTGGYTADKFVSEGLKNIRPDMKYIYTFPSLMIAWHGGPAWSGMACLWWHFVEVGDRLELELPATEAGRYKMYLATMRGSNFGRLQVEVNGKPAPQPIHLRQAEERYAGEVLIGQFHLKEGANTLSFTMLEEDPAPATAERVFCVDYIRLEKLGR